MFQSICVCTRLRRATREVSRHYDTALAPAGLNVAQFALLRAIERSGTPSIGDLAGAVQLDASTLGRNLRVLERAGLVVLDAARDQRRRLIELTEAGQDALVRAAPLWEAAQAAMEERLGDGGRDRLFALLGQIAAG